MGNTIPERPFTARPGAIQCSYVLRCKRPCGDFTSAHYAHIHWNGNTTVATEGYHRQLFPSRRTSSWHVFIGDIPEAKRNRVISHIFQRTLRTTSHRCQKTYCTVKRRPKTSIREFSFNGTPETQVWRTSQRIGLCPFHSMFKLCNQKIVFTFPPTERYTSRFS